MINEDIFDRDMNEQVYYENASVEYAVNLPLTKKGFEALLTVVCSRFGLPCDDASRMVLAGYIHHIPNEQNTTTIETLGKVLHKAIANSTSWRIDQEVKLKRRQEAQAEADKADSENALHEKASKDLSGLGQSLVEH